ncbi:GNAT family N-acetyltransferase [Aquincola sp. S2]|uniref:GNAT family N-acetyltransferase n=1 Tax=Pseudaquabacterium terrae TaxID=2732868 RepID=A0ABX2EI59_9BURK|nr:GNAT family N-acetyltransferase [Aquabacterium terrae]NRF68340.1 GNAT family N-acetyltransferase [Aquabacterium terrae]
MTTITLRRAALPDLDTLAALFDAYRQFYEQAPDRAAARAFIAARLRKSESVLLLAEDAQGRGLGFCQLYPTFCSISAAPVYILSDLFVMPDARKTGTGRQLLLAAERQAHTDGMVRMDLTTARTNLAAQSLYESLGWTRDPVFIAYNRPIAA